MAQENLTNPQAAAPKAKMIYQITGVFDLIGKAFEVYKNKFWNFVGMMLIPVLGGLPLAVIVGLFVGLDHLSLDSGAVLAIINVILGLLMVVAVLILIVVAVSAQAGLYTLVKSEKELTIKEAFLQGKSIAWQFFVINLLVGIFVLLWSLLLIIPGIIMGVYYTFAAWFLIEKGSRGREAIRNSKNLVKNYWWAVFGRVLAVQVILMVITGLPSVIFEAINNNGLTILWTLISNLISFLAAPFVLIYVYLIFKDLLNIKGEASTGLSK